MNQPATPMLEKEREARQNGHSQEIGDFLEWLGTQGIRLARYDERSDACRNCGHPEPHDRHEAVQAHWGGLCGHDASEDEDEENFDCACDWNERGNPDQLVSIRDTTRELLAQYFEIDLAQSESERRALLDYIRSKHPKVKA